MILALSKPAGILQGQEDQKWARRFVFTGSMFLIGDVILVIEIDLSPGMPWYCSTCSRACSGRLMNFNMRKEGMPRVGLFRWLTATLMNADESWGSAPTRFIIYSRSSS